MSTALHFGFRFSDWFFKGRFIRLLVVSGCLLSVGAKEWTPAASAQVVPSEAGFVSDFARPGEPTMVIYLWGNISQGGLWRVERDVDLIELLSAAQVPGVGTISPGVRQRIHVNIYRTVDGDRQRVYREEISQLLEEGAEYPSLSSRDIVEIEIRTRQRIGLGTISTVIGTLSSITLLTLRILSGT
jgi:hypothetical protein